MSSVDASVRSHPRIPLGGIKEASHERERSRFGIRQSKDTTGALVQG